MRHSKLLLFLFLALSFETFSQSDTIVINLKDNSVDKFSITQIKNIKFENITGIEEFSSFIKELNLKGNHPNPASESTTIEFEISEPGEVTIEIYNYSGEHINSLKCNNCISGKNYLIWDCRNKANILVESGSYFYEVRFKNEIYLKKLLIIK